MNRKYISNLEHRNSSSIDDRHAATVGMVNRMIRDKTRCLNTYVTIDLLSNQNVNTGNGHHVMFDRIDNRFDFENLVTLSSSSSYDAGFNNFTKGRFRLKKGYMYELHGKIALALSKGSITYGFQRISYPYDRLGNIAWATPDNGSGEAHAVISSQYRDEIVELRRIQGGTNSGWLGGTNSSHSACFVTVKVLGKF